MKSEIVDLMGINPFSLYMDEKTDVSSMKDFAMMSRYLIEESLQSIISDWIANCYFINSYYIEI